MQSMKKIRFCNYMDYDTLFTTKKQYGLINLQAVLRDIFARQFCGAAASGLQVF